MTGDHNNEDSKLIHDENISIPLITFVHAFTNFNTNTKHSEQIIKFRHDISCLAHAYISVPEDNGRNDMLAK